MKNEEKLMEINIPRQEESIIKIFGVGGGGSNAVNHMCRQGINGVEYVICNTDIQALRISPVKNRIQIGKELTEGLGAGSRPERGKQSAIESMEYIRTILERNTKMIFVTAGMGGGTGTGAAPIIAKQARELGILTIGVVTIPFHFEGKHRVEQAMAGVDELAGYVDALLIICNEKLREMYGDLKLSKAFEMADNVLTIAVKSIAEIITLKGYVNVDFADVDVVVRNSGVALMGAGEAKGTNRSIEAVTQALRSPLLNSSDIRGASRILLNFLYGSEEVTMDEITLITDYLRKLVGHNVNIVWGAGRDNTMEDELRVAVIATGFNGVPVDNRATFVSFKVEEVPELELKLEDTRKLEEEERQRKLRQNESRFRRQQQEEQRRVADRQNTPLPAFEEEEEFAHVQEQPSRRPLPKNEQVRGRNEVPDVDNWFRRKFGGMFEEGLNRDQKM